MLYSLLCFYRSSTVRNMKISNGKTKFLRQNKCVRLFVVYESTVLYTQPPLRPDRLRVPTSVLCSREIYVNKYRCFIV